MEEIKIGEYVRTKQGCIYKVKSVYKDMIWWCDLAWISEKDIVNHSNNIIDLIEVGDVVRVLDHEWDRIFNLDDENILESFIEDCKEENWKLVSIVTKEQFALIEYKIGE